MHIRFAEDSDKDLWISLDQHIGEKIEYTGVVNDITDVSKQILGEKLVGVYLHGSIAMRCFNPKKSDIDLIFVIEGEMTAEEKLEFMKVIVKLNESAPKKGLELSVVKREVCQSFIYPTPYELHFSPMHLDWFRRDPKGYVENMKGLDKDLAAHFTVIRACGIVLYGAAIQDVFSEVPREDYLDSIFEDIKNAKENIIREPMYIVLTLCRVYAAVQDDLVLSKAQGGVWGLLHIANDYHELIQSALESYTSEKEMITDQKNALQFAEYMLKMLGVQEG